MENKGNLILGGIVLWLSILTYTVYFSSGASASASTLEATRALSSTPAVTSPAIKPTDTNTQPQQPEVDPATAANVVFAENEFDFGTLEEGEKVEHIFKFENTSANPLTISNARGSCGCTVPEWPKEPIAPGESGEIKVKFDSKGKKGKQSKSVTITANTIPQNTILTITSDVIKLEEEGADEGKDAAKAK